jgi:hypothetical protein
MHYFPNGQPKHVRPVRADATPLGARCTEPRPSGPCHQTYCPRHAPAAYADHMARHSIDSIRAETFHNFGITR